MIYTIGFTQKTAEQFFSLLSNNKIDVLIDIRLNNKSQLASFSKYPDVDYFLSKLCNIKYIHDLRFAPTDDLLKKYRKKEITWDEYNEIFNEIMRDRNTEEYIKNNYSKLRTKNICLLCSEPLAQNCHRSLVAECFKDVFNSKIINI